MREYKLNLKKYGIGKNLFTELDGFCQQYNDKREVIESGVPCCPETLEKFKADIRLIDDTAFEIDPELAPYIIKAVTENIKFHSFKDKYGITLNFGRFTESRQMFFYRLAIKKGCLIKRL